MRLPRWLAVGALIYAPARAAAAATSTIPAAWTNTTLAVPKAERVLLAQGGFAAMNTLYDASENSLNGFLSDADFGRHFWTMALADSIAGTAKYQDMTSSALLRTQFNEWVSYSSFSAHADGDGTRSAMLPGNDFLSTIAYQGIAAAQAYRAYGNNSLLDLAETVWADVAAYQISSAQAASGRHPLRKVSFQGTCNVGAAGTVPVAGAVFSELDSTSLVFDQATSALLLLSAHLAELTQNATYTGTARLAADALSSIMLDPGTGLVIESGTLGSVATEGVTSEAASVVCNLGRALNPYSTGMYIEGLAVLASVDPNNSSEWNDRMANAVMSATQNALWFGGLAGAIPGVLTFPLGTGSGVADPNIDERSYSGRLVQGLYEPYNRTGDPNLRAYLGAFIGTQVNALLAHATQPGSNVYAVNWAGLPLPSGAAVTSDLGGQISALCALTAALALPDANPSGPVSAATSTVLVRPGASASSTFVGDTRTHTALTFGLGLGLGIPAVAIIAVVLVWMLVRRRRRRAALYGLSPAKSDELSMRAAGVPIVGMLPDSARRLVTPYAPVLPPSPLRELRSGRRKGDGTASAVVAGEPRADPTHEQVHQTQEMRHDENVWVSIRSAPARSGRGHDPLPYTPELHVPSTLPDGGTSPGGATSPADAIATEELLRVLDARGMLPTAQEPLPMYEEIGRRP